MYQFIKAFLPKGSALFSNDKWQRDLAKLKKETKKGGYDPLVVATIVADALNRKAPSFLLLDDLHMIQVLPDNQQFIQFIVELTHLLQPGVFFLITSTPSFASWILQHAPQTKKLFQMQVLQPLTSDEATLIVGKWLESHRLVDGLHPLFPFSTSSVHLLNSQGHGTIQSLLNLSDMALTAAVYQKAVVITDQTVKEALVSVEEQKPQVLDKMEKSSQETPELFQLMPQQPLHQASHEKIPRLFPSKQVANAEIFKTGPDICIPSNLSDQESKRESEEHNMDDPQKNLIPIFFSESRQYGIKEASAVSPFAHPHMDIPQEVTNEYDESLREENAGCTRMKTHHTPIITTNEDNGSRKKKIEPPSIMHHVKKTNEQHNGKTKPDHTLSASKPGAQHLLCSRDDVNEVWEPAKECEEQKDNKTNIENEHLVEDNNDELNAELSPINQQHVHITSHNEQLKENIRPIATKQDNRSTRVLRVRCPECSKDFSIELNQHSHFLACPFCGFQGEI
jgi:hypothetical protein